MPTKPPWHQPKRKQRVIDSRIIEVTETTVTLECLVDRARSRLELRTFPREQIAKVAPLVEGHYVVLRIFQSDDVIMFRFSNGDRLVKDRAPFEETPGLDDLDFDFQKQLTD